jgi:hypothetical protein
MEGRVTYFKIITFFFLTQNIEQWRALVNTVTNQRVS